MTLWIKLYLFYTYNTHVSVIQDCHIFLSFGFLPVIGPFNEFHTQTAQEFGRGLLPFYGCLVNHLLNRLVFSGQLVRKVFPERDAFHLCLFRNGLSESGFNASHSRFGNGNALQQRKAVVWRPVWNFDSINIIILVLWTMLVEGVMGSRRVFLRYVNAPAKFDLAIAFQGVLQTEPLKRISR